MTTITYNALNTASFKMPNFVERRAALPDMQTHTPVLTRAAEFVAHVALAAVPFTAIAWMFLAH